MTRISQTTFDTISQTTPGSEKGHLGSKSVSNLTLKLKGGGEPSPGEKSALIAMVTLTILFSVGSVAMLALGGHALADPAFASDLGLSAAGAWALTGVGGGLMFLLISVRSAACSKQESLKPPILGNLCLSVMCCGAPLLCGESSE